MAAQRSGERRAETTRPFHLELDAIVTAIALRVDDSSACKQSPWRIGM